MKKADIFRIPEFLSASEIVKVPVYYENNKWRLNSSLIWIGMLVTIYFLLFVITGIFSPVFLSMRNLQNVFQQFIPICILSIGMTVIFSNGGFDFSVGAVGALVSILMALLLNSGINPVPAAVISLLAALFIGLINSLLAGIVRFPGFIVTIFMASVVRGIGFLFSGGTIIKLDNELSLNMINLIGVILIMIIGFVSIIWLQFPAYNTKFIKEEKFQSPAVQAFFLGIPYIVMSLLAGFVGIFMLGRLNSAVPSYGANSELTIILILVLGGAFFCGRHGNPIGVFIGCMIFAVLQNFFNLINVIVYLQYIILGVLFVISLLANFLFNIIVGLLYRNKQYS
jgi:ribose transport system permease protein